VADSRDRALLWQRGESFAGGDGSQGDDDRLNPPVISRCRMSQRGESRLHGGHRLTLLAPDLGPKLRLLAQHLAELSREFPPARCAGSIPFTERSCPMGRRHL